MCPFLVNGVKRRFNLVCGLQLHYFQGVKMSLGNPISTFPAGNQRPGLSCLGASRPVVVVVDGISAVTRSCQLVTLRFKMSTNSERPLRQATDTLSNQKAAVQFHDGFERSYCLPFCGKTVICTKIINTLRTGLLNCLNARSRGLTFRHRASCIQGQAFHYSPQNAFYIFNQQIYFII